MTQEVTLAAVTATDTAELLALETMSLASPLTRTRGRLPSLQEFEAQFCRGLHSQFIARRADQCVGFAAVRDVDEAARVGFLYVLIAAEMGLADEVDLRVVLLNRLFRDLNIDTYYDESPMLSINVALSALLCEHLPFQTEGLLRCHYNFHGRHLDKPVLSVRREDWPRDGFVRRAAVSGSLPLPDSQFELNATDHMPRRAAQVGPGVPEREDLRRPLTGRNVELRPVRQRDYEALYVSELSSELGPLWRHRGRTPSPEQFVHTLWNGVVAQFIVANRADGLARGLICLYNADFDHGFAHFAMTRLGKRQPAKTALMEGAFLFLDYTFSCWPLRKVYGEALEFNFNQYKSGIDWLFDVEARMSSRVFYGGRHWDQIMISLDRARWDALSPRYLRYAVGDEVPLVDA